MKTLSLVLVLAAVVGLANAQTGTPQTRTLSLTDCVQQALERNLDLQIERINPQVAMFNLRRAYAGYDPAFGFGGEHDYSLSGGGFNSTLGVPTLGLSSDVDKLSSSLGGSLPWGLGYVFSGNVNQAHYSQGPNSGDVAGGSAGVSLTQPLLKNLWIDTTRLNISVSKNRLKYSELGLRLKIMDTVTSVENAYYDLVAARENVKVQEKALQLAEQLLAENKKRVEVGTLAPLDEKQSQSQVAARRSDLLTARQTLATAHNALRGLLNYAYNEIVEPVETLAAPAQEFSVLESLKKGMAQRPELLQAKLDLEKQGIQLKYDRNQLFPELDLIGSYAHGAGGALISDFSQALGQIQQGSQPSYTYGAKLTVPLGNRAARNTYKADKLTLKQQLLTLKKLEDSILLEIDNNVIAARVGFERVDSTRQARLYAEAALAAEQKKLENGKSTSFVVLQLQRDLTAAGSDEIAALADYNKSLANLARSEGRTLERRAINLQVK